MGYRQNFDLMKRIGRKNFFERGLFGDEWSRKFILIDTLGHHICSLIGHSEKTYISRTEGEKTIICYRCNKTIIEEGE